MQYISTRTGRYDIMQITSLALGQPLRIYMHRVSNNQQDLKSKDAQVFGDYCYFMDILTKKKEKKYLYAVNLLKVLQIQFARF